MTQPQGRQDDVRRHIVAEWIAEQNGIVDLLGTSAIDTNLVYADADDLLARIDAASRVRQVGQQQ